MWLSLDGPQSDTEIELHWGTWWRKIEGDLPLLLVCHHSQPNSPLRIVADRPIRWAAGVGRPCGAIPINHGWVPDSVDAAQRAISDTRHAVLESIRRKEPAPDGAAEPQWARSEANPAGIRRG